MHTSRIGSGRADALREFDRRSTARLPRGGSNQFDPQHWPSSRKDMEVYGDRGSYLTVGRDMYRLSTTDPGESLSRADPPSTPANDPLSVLIAVALGKAEPSGPSSLQTNAIVTEILDAARRSAETGRTIHLDDQPARRQ